jgi:hypothetical protein
MSVQKAVEANGWELVGIIQGALEGETVVMSKRSSSPFGQDRVYVTHKHYANRDSLNYGHYDMTLEEAVASMTERCK